MAIKEEQLRMNVQIFNGRYVCMSGVLTFLDMLNTVVSEEPDSDGLITFQFEDGSKHRLYKESSVKAFCNYMKTQLEMYKAP
jgi:hypothetical protein